MIEFTNADGTPFMDARAAAFRAIFQRLRDDKVLARVVEKWSGMPFAVPKITANELPYMQVSLAAGPIKVHSPSSHESTLNVEVSYAVNAAGSDEETAWIDIINLYAHIEKAINPFERGGPSWLREAVAEVDPTAVVGNQVTFQQAGFSSIPLNDINAIAGKCVLSVTLRIDTCRSK